MKKKQIINNDCLIALKELDDNSVDSIVTDPPYELGFMGKKWDNTGIAYNVEMWKECLRVLKPGGHLLSFGGTRTYHRMAVAIEDAGFEVRDMIEWVYGSGFPKSLNIGKAVDKIQGNEREVTGNRKAHDIRGGALMEATVPELKKEISSYQIDITKGTSQYEGWGTALKPAHEPICMARKPLAEKTVAENCLKYGTGGINIDESRVGTETIKSVGGRKSVVTGDERTGKALGMNAPHEPLNTFHEGRFPANLIHDNSEEVRECFPETKTGAVKTTVDNGANQPINLGGGLTKERIADSGNASRFFKSIIYTAKASKRERNKWCEGLEEKEWIKNACVANRNIRPNNPNSNNHPTVKPLALMEYLIKMVTPKGGVVLDPFAGSGSTLVAAKQNGFDYIGIELTAEYIPIIEARLNAVKNIQERLL